MNLVFIYGPPAAGKLTVANELAKITNYKVFHNHAALDLVTPIFGWENPVRQQLSRQIRLEIFDAAAREGIDMITTFGASGEKYHSFIKGIMDVVEGKNGGDVKFVQLTAQKEELLRRVGATSRKEHGKISSEELLSEKFTSEAELFEPFPFKEHLHIDNTNVTPEAVAKQIADYYKFI
jgi:RNase adaptor protein for sRNA GlmZ degradation